MFTHSDTIRYLLAGIWNTLFGYGVGVLLLITMRPIINIIYIIIVSNIISISMAFIVYKIYVFRTHGNWISEYLKCYLVYGGSALISSTLLFFLITKIDCSIWVAQGIVTAIVITLSFLMHKRYTFN